MKTRPLPDTDLARIAPLNRDGKRRALLQQKDGFSPITYRPARSVTLDTLNAQSPLLGPTAETPLSVLENQVRKAARSEDEEKSNLEVVRLLRHIVKREGYRAYQVNEFSGFNTRAGDTATYWSKAIVVDSAGQLLIPLADYRRTYRLTATAKRFAASVMHHAIRVQNPTDFGTAKLVVFQFPYARAGSERSVTLEIVDDADLYSRDELAAMIAETFELWDEVLAERAAEARRSAGRSR